MDRRKNHKQRLIFNKLQQANPSEPPIYKEREPPQRIILTVEATTTTPLNLTINIDPNKPDR